jgi:hypothetical protein
MRAATGGVDDHEVDSVERLDERACESLSLVETAGVNRERATAALGWRDHVEAVGSENSGRGQIDVWKDRLLYAARKQPDPGSRRPVGRCECGNLALSSPARGHLRERPEGLRQR